jgi:predicted ester cyclase
MDDLARQHLIERYIAAYNSFDIEGMAAVLSDSIRFDNIAQGATTHETVGLDAFRTLATSSAAMFASRRQTVLALEFDPAQVIAKIVFEGTLAVDVPDGPRAGTQVAMEGSSTFRFDGEKIAAIVDRS